MKFHLKLSSLTILALASFLAFAHDATRLGECSSDLLLKTPSSDLAQWTADYPKLSEQYAKALTLVKQQQLPTLSIVIPAFREEQRIGNSLHEIKNFFDAFPYPVEILVRIEKSPDNSVTVAENMVAGDSRFEVSGHPVQRGKGYAVRQGMMRASGDFVLFMDADLSTPLPEIFHFLSLRADGNTSDVMIGDRHHPDSRIEADQSLHRQVMGATFRGLIRTVLTSYGLKGINDTQCGFKMFTKSAAQKLFGLSRVDGFAFDIEILLLASQLEMNISPIDILWRDDPRSTVHPIRDPLKMLRDVITMRRQVRASVYRTQSPVAEPQ